MQILLSILFAPAVSQVRSAGFACSKSPAHSTLYGLAQKVSNWKPNEIPDARMSIWSIQQLTEIILSSKKQYEAEEDEKQCDSLLCKQEINFRWLGRASRQDWSNTPADYRVVLEDYIEQIGRAAYNLSSAFCLAAGPKIQERVYLARHLQKKLSDCNGGSVPDLQGWFSHSILKRFDGADKMKCRSLDPQFFACIGHNLPQLDLTTLPEEVGKQLHSFADQCVKIKNELESMNGPGLGCSFS